MVKFGKCAVCGKKIPRAHNRKTCSEFCRKVAWSRYVSDYMRRKKGEEKNDDERDF